MVSVGSFNKAIVYPREVFEIKILLNDVNIMAFKIDIKNGFL